MLQHHRRPRGRHRAETPSLFAVSARRGAAVAGAGALAVTSLGGIIPASAAPADAGSAVESNGVPGSRSTVTGQVRLDVAGAPTSADAGDQGLPGVQINARWTDEDGSVSPVYYTTSDASGQGGFSVLLRSWVDDAGVQHTFDASGQEKLEVWATGYDAERLQVAYKESDPVGTFSQRDRAYWSAANDNVTGWSIALHERPQSWLELPSSEWGTNPNTTHGGRTTGSVFWDVHHAWGGNGVPHFNPALGDRPAVGTTVVGSYVNDDVAREFKAWENAHPGYARADFQAAQQEILAAYEARTGRSGIAETASAVVGANGSYTLQFDGLFGNSYASKGSIPRADLYGTPASGPTDGTWFSGFWNSKHMNSEYMYVHPVVDGQTDVSMSSFQDAYFQDGSDSAGSTYQYPSIVNGVDFALYPAGR